MVREYWIDGDEKKHRIATMPDDYIKNCIKCIISCCKTYSIHLDYYNIVIHMDEHESQVLRKDWCYEHSQEYLDAFCYELKQRERKRKHRKDF